MRTSSSTVQSINHPLIFTPPEGEVRVEIVKIIPLEVDHPVYNTTMEAGTYATIPISKIAIGVDAT